jgi:cell division protein FtsQ
VSETTTTSTTSPPRLRMDPRIRERRVAVQRDAGRRRLRLVIAGASVAGALGVAYGLTRSPVFDVDEVRVLGAARTTAAQIEKAGGLAGGPQLADVKPAVVAARLARLPWVQEAKVVRHWPGTVEVTLLERTPLATLPATAGGWALVDDTGRVLETMPEPAPGMVQVNAAPAPAPGEHVAAETLGALGVLDALPPSLSERVNGLTVAEDGVIDVHAVGLPTIHFGPPTAVRPKLVALTTLVARTNLKGVKAIDVRVPTAPVLTRA